MSTNDRWVMVVVQHCLKPTKSHIKPEVLTYGS